MKLFDNDGSNYVVSIAIRLNYIEDKIKKNKRSIVPEDVLKLFSEVSIHMEALEKAIDDMENLLHKRKELLK